MNRSPFVAALAVIGLGLASTAALAGDFDETRSMKVRFAELDLSKQAGAEELYRRIKRAAFIVCGGQYGSIGAYGVKKSECYKSAVSNAVQQVNSPVLTALHGAKPQRVASR